MNMPTFRDAQEPNRAVAELHYLRVNAELSAENAELRGQVSVERARRRSAIRALTAGDPTAALAALTEEGTT